MAKRKRRLTDPFTRTRGSRKVVADINTLKVGDVIRLIRLSGGYTGGPRANQSGVVREKELDSIGVEFFRPFELGHYLSGDAGVKDRHGWYLGPEDRVSRFTRDKKRASR